MLTQDHDTFALPGRDAHDGLGVRAHHCGSCSLRLKNSSRGSRWLCWKGYIGGKMLVDGIKAKRPKRPQS